MGTRADMLCGYAIHLLFMLCLSAGRAFESVDLIPENLSNFVECRRKFLKITSIVARKGCSTEKNEFKLINNKTPKKGQRNFTRIRNDK